MVVHLWVIVTTPVSDGRRRGPASSPPAEVVGEPEHTTAGSDAYVLELALTVIAVITAWSIMAAWWALR